MSHGDTKRILVHNPQKLSHTLYDSLAPVWAILYLIFIVIFFLTMFKAVM